jgi:hypothetical protein
MSNHANGTADQTLTEIERILTTLSLPVSVRESLLDAVEMYGDARADEALTADAV